jgi:hypothetical protein
VHEELSQFGITSVNILLVGVTLLVFDTAAHGEETGPAETNEVEHLRDRQQGPCGSAG